MIRNIVPVYLVILFSLALRVYSLSALQGSPCYNTCNGDQATSSGDIVCIDDDFRNTRKGRNLSSCLTCLSSSNYTNGNMGDNVLFLYYLSSVQQTCLSGKPAEPISDCSGTCNGLSSAFASIGGRAFFQSPYAFCNTSNSVYEDDAPDCAKCLRSQEGTVVLGNFVDVGNSACLDQPDLSNGTSISGAGQIFNATRLISSSNGTKNATSLTTSSSSTTTSMTSTTTSESTSSTQMPGTSSTAASSNAKTDGDDGNSGGLSRGAAAGIGIVLGMIGIAAIIFFAVWTRRRLLRQQAEDTQDAGGISVSTGPWEKMKESPQMREAELTVRGATPPAAGVFVPPPPLPAEPKKSKSFKSLRSLKSLRMTPRTSAWYYAANPKSASDVTALPQRGWD